MPDDQLFPSLHQNDWAWAKSSQNSMERIISFVPLCSHVGPNSVSWGWPSFGEIRLLSYEEDLAEDQGEKAGQVNSHSAQVDCNCKETVARNQSTHSNASSPYYWARNKCLQNVISTTQAGPGRLVVTQFIKPVIKNYFGPSTSIIFGPSIQRSKKWLLRGLVKFANAVARLVCPDLLG